MLAAAGFDGSLIVWDTSSWERVHEVTTENAVLSLAFSPDGRVLAAGTSSGQVEFIDLGTGERIGEPVSGQRDWVNSVAFAPDGSTLVAGSEDGSIALLGPSTWTDNVAIWERRCAGSRVGVSPKPSGPSSSRSNRPSRDVPASEPHRDFLADDAPPMTDVFILIRTGPVARGGSSRGPRCA